MEVWRIDGVERDYEVGTGDEDLDMVAYLEEENRNIN